LADRLSFPTRRSSDLYELMPQLRASAPAAIDMQVVLDRTPTIRASLHEIERTLVISVALVVMVVFLFLRSAAATLVPAVAVPASDRKSTQLNCSHVKI